MQQREDEGGEQDEEDDDEQVFVLDIRGRARYEVLREYLRILEEPPSQGVSKLNTFFWG